MNKTAIKKFAVWARNDLIHRVTLKAAEYGVEENKIENSSADSINGKLLSKEEKANRVRLIAEIQKKGFKNVIEEAAYTWFNRFIALRYMEVNGYLPTHIRVFTDDKNTYNPQILKEVVGLDFEWLDKQKIIQLKSDNKDEELYKYLLISQCNALNKELPKMFDKIEAYMELLFPDNLLREGSVIEQMVTTIPEEDWKDQVQIIGWMYQYWNIEPKEKAMDGKTYKKEDFAAVTQLFTPDWIVRYMVENSLGRVWKETHQDFDTNIWKYYLAESEENKGKIAATLEKTDLEKITFLDPCMGSGHILVYAFDVFMDLYNSLNYSPKEACESIIKNNLFGVDLDKRAWQLSYFALKMKARQYDSGFLRRGIEPNVCYMQELDLPEGVQLTNELKTFVANFKNADVYGSLTPVKKASDAVRTQVADYKDGLMDVGAKELLERMIAIADVLDNKYSVVCTNPPYMGSNTNNILYEYVKNNFPNSKTDLFSVFVEKTCKLSKNIFSLITMQSWMFLSSYSDFRDDILNSTLINMCQLGARGFDEISGEIVQTTSFVFSNKQISNYVGTYKRLISGKSESEKESLFFDKNYTFKSSYSKFLKLPSKQFAYWISDTLCDAYSNSNVNSYGRTRKGMATGLNEEFVRQWYEVNYKKLGFNLSREEAAKSIFKWFPYANGGSVRKWYGNYSDVVNWENDGNRLRTEKHDTEDRIRAVNLNLDYIFQPGFSWTSITSKTKSMRVLPKGFLFSSASNAWFGDEKVLYILGLLNSCLTECLLSPLTSGMNANPGDIGNIPIIFDEEKKDIMERIIKNNISLSKADWDSYETSWDFQRHPLMPIFCEDRKNSIRIADSFDKWRLECNERFARLKANEEELNRIFIEIYGLGNELTPEVSDIDVTIRKADLKNDIKSFISYVVGCMLGRYSISVDGLVFAGGDSLVLDAYKPFAVDEDNVIPITDEEYFDDDITGRFVQFVELVYGKDTLAENLMFIANALGGNGKEPKGVIRNYFLNEFYKDHCKTYQNKPIYWLFDAGKKNSFKALIYMHRYQKDTLARLRTDYVHEQQGKYRTKIAELTEKSQNAGSTSERVKIDKELAKFRDQDAELHSYEEKVNHLAAQMISIDLDDGVKVNYEKFSDVLAKVK